MQLLILVNNNNKIMQNRPISIDMPDIHSPKYKSNVKEIEESVKSLNNFTSHLQDKVASMLKGQQTEFVNSYKDHISHIQIALQQYQKQIKEYEQKIQHYQNEGALSILIKRVHFLQGQQKKLLTTLQKKDEQIFGFKTDIGLFQSEIRSLKSHIKQLMHFKIEGPKQKHFSKEKEREGDFTFATQINVVHRSNMRSHHSQMKNYQTTLDYSADHHQDGLTARKDEQIKRINRQISQLKKKNREMSSVTSKIIQKSGEVNEFFLKTVEQLKKKILVRKQFKKCSFQDFKQEDKLELMIRVLSNDEILKHLHEKLFHNHPQSPITQPQSAITQPQSAITHPQSPITQPQSAISKHFSPISQPQSERLDLKSHERSSIHNKLPAIYSQRRGNE